MTLVKKLADEITKLNPMQAKFIQSSLNSLSADEIELFQHYLSYCLKSNIAMDFLAQAYHLIVKDTLTEQIYFKRHKKYRYSSYDEVASSVYMSEEYMSKYMYGLALSAFLWPNHRQLHHFFLQRLPKEKTGKYLEVGPGHGFYFMQSMRHCNFEHYQGVDISPTSVQLTNDILASNQFGNFTDYSIRQENFLTWKNDESYDLIVMAEVLEHVENPAEFLNKIKQLLAPNGSAFITTCINAPAIDHIYLYQTVEQLKDQIAQANFVINAELIVPYAELSLEQSLEQRLPVNIALELVAA